MWNLNIDENGIDKRNTLLHHERILNFDLFGYTLQSGNHFTLKTFLNSILYYHERYENSKNTSRKKSRLLVRSI